MRSDTVRWATGRRAPRSTPSITMRDEPMPVMSAPIATSISQRSTTSGSRAALSSTVVPAASTAAVTMFSVAPTLGNGSTMSAPCSRSARACSSPWASLNSAPIASRAAMCMSIGRAPKSSPPGIDRVTSPQRVSSGPSTLTEARMRSASSYGATGTSRPPLVSTSRSGPERSHVTPIAASSSPMIDTSTRSGTLASSYTPSASRLAAISLSAEFLAPGTSIRPDSGPRCSTRIVPPGAVAKGSLTGRPVRRCERASASE